MASSKDAAGTLGHRPMIVPRIEAPVPRVPEDVLAVFRAAYLPDISDAVGPLYTMDPAIRPLYQPMRRLVGQALTVKAPPGDNLTVHGAMLLVHPGDVVVIDWRGYVGACGSGATSLLEPIALGLIGVVIDGAWRDVGQLQTLDFPVFGKAINALSPPKERPGEINVAIACGGVVVEPGDIVVADEEGVVVVSLRWAQQVASSLHPHNQGKSVTDFTDAELQAKRAHRLRYFTGKLDEYGGRMPTLLDADG